MLGFHRRRLSARQGALTRTLIVGALSLACLASLSLRATAASAASLPPQGIYEECAPSDQQQCAGELAQISRAGFQLVVNYTAWEGTASDLQTYAATAAADHLQVIWPVDAPAWTDSPLATSLIQAYPALAASCGCVNNQGFINYVVGLVKTFPATWGYYVGDEDGPSQALPVSLLSLSVRTLDPSHQTLYVGQSGPSVYSQLRLFQTDASYLGADVYPVGTGAPLSVVSDAASQLQTLAAPIHRNSVMVLQAFSWAEYPAEMNLPAAQFPTESDLLTMRNDALAANPSMILWYNLHDIQRSDNPAQHWSDLVQAAFASTSGPNGDAAASAASRTAPPTRPAAGVSHKTHAAGLASKRRARRQPRRR